MRNNNIPIMNAIVISLRTVSNLSLQRALKINLAKIAEGESMSSCLENIPPNDLTISNSLILNSDYYVLRILI